jgi:hypothetical protein
MLIRHLMWERTPPGGVRAREQSALAGRRGPRELLIGKPAPGRTALAVRRGSQELPIDKPVPGEHLSLGEQGPILVV